LREALNRYRDTKRATYTLFAFNPDAAVVQLNKIFTNFKAYAGAFFVGGAESSMTREREYFILVGLFNTNTRIGYADNGVPIFNTAANADAAPWIGKFYRVRYQVAQYYLYHFAVGIDDHIR